jgi:hypothetical protein
MIVRMRVAIFALLVLSVAARPLCRDESSSFGRLKNCTEWRECLDFFQRVLAEPIHRHIHENKLDRRGVFKWG